MGYRLRMTLAFGLLALASVVFLTLLFLTSGYREFKSDRMASVERMATCLAGNLYWDMQAGDQVRVQESLERFAHGLPALRPPAVLVLDPHDRIYSGSPEGLRALRGQPAVAAGFTLSGSGDWLTRAADGSATLEGDDGFVSGARILRDGQDHGVVLVDYPLTALREHFLSLWQVAALYSLALLAVLLGIGWLLGRQLVRPITRLRECMQRVGQGDLDVSCDCVSTRDEIGDLARGFDDMLAGLREKRVLEQEMLSSERLAAVGQVAAGVAHEINNPLGGMLNAINTFERHGSDPEVARRTLDLLARGLRQIQGTVQALLVQSRVQAHPLDAADLEDLRTLIHPEAHRKGLQLDWRCDLVGGAPLPSTSVRHILMNLLLNAIQASPEGGRVALCCERGFDHLVLRVEDDGPGLTPEQKRRMFEPFFSGTGGHGLGLWVTWQTVGQLGGSIQVLDRPAGTAMEIRLPLAEPAAAPAGAAS